MADDLRTATQKILRNALAAELQDEEGNPLYAEFTWYLDNDYQAQSPVLGLHPLLTTPTPLTARRTKYEFVIDLWVMVLYEVDAGTVTIDQEFANQQLNDLAYRVYRYIGNTRSTQNWIRLELRPPGKTDAFKTRSAGYLYEVIPLAITVEDNK